MTENSKVPDIKLCMSETSSNMIRKKKAYIVFLKKDILGEGLYIGSIQRVLADSAHEAIEIVCDYIRQELKRANIRDISYEIFKCKRDTNNGYELYYLIR